MDTDATPSCPYLMADPPRSSGRALLSRLMWEYCCLHWGLSPAEVAAALGGNAGEDHDDGADEALDEGTARRVALAANLLGGVLADGGVRAFARPIGGGEPAALAATVWEVDDFRPLFLASALDPGRPFDRSAPPTHWIFVDAADGERLLEASVADVARPPARSRGRNGDEPVAAPPLTAVPVVRSEERLLRRPEVERRTGLARSTIYARMKDGRFPKQVSGGSMATWRESEVNEWIANPT